MERERTPEPIVEVGIQLHLTDLSLLYIKQYLYELSTERSRKVIHNGVQKADRRPDSDVDPNQIAVDETVIQVNEQRHWLYAAVDPDTNQIRHTRLFQRRTTRLIVLFLRELHKEQHLERAAFLVDAAAHLTAALERLGPGFR